MQILFRFRIPITFCSIALTLCFTSCNSSDRLSGEGASFPKDFYEELFDHYYDLTGARIEYGGQGSGAGITSLKNKVVDFAGSDAYLSDEELKSMPAEVIHIPTCMGAVVLGYNLKGVKTLQLTGKIIADIYLGNIVKWNDKAIAELNPTENLPNTKIIPIRRSDGSGTTFVFSDYLTKVSPQWKETLGRGKSLKWPNGIGLAAKGNANVAATLEQTNGAIAYIGSEYSFSRNIPSATIANANGEFIAPSLESISKAAKGDIPSDTRTMITNSTAKGSYPISCFTWMLIYKEQNYQGRKRDKAVNTVKLMRWILSDEAQSLAETVDFAPLPWGVRQKALHQLEKITYGGLPI